MEDMFRSAPTGTVTVQVINEGSFTVKTDEPGATSEPIIVEVVDERHGSPDQFLKQEGHSSNTNAIVVEIDETGTIVGANTVEVDASGAIFLSNAREQLSDTTFENIILNEVDSDLSAVIENDIVVETDSPSTDGSLFISEGPSPNPKGEANTSLFSCEACGKSFQKVMGLRRHTTSCIKKRLRGTRQSKRLVIENCAKVQSLSSPKKAAFTCEVCKKKFTYATSFEKHVADLHSTESSALPCSQCSARCRNIEVLEEHMKKSHEQKRFKCPHCPQTFSRNYHVTRHLEQKNHHRDETGTSFSCNICGQDFGRKDNLVIHLRWHINRNFAFCCTHCSEAFKTQKALIRHVNRIHSGVFECDYCGKVFNNRNSIAKHLESHGERKHGCEVCGFRCHTVEVLRRHLLRHTSDKPYKCSQCTRSFIQAHELRAHKIKHAGKQDFVCPHCDTPHNSKNGLLTHVRRVHEGEPELRCPYEGCKSSKKVFLSKNTHKEHLKLHEAEKTFQCTMCNKSYHSRQLLTSHALTHTLERPRRCLYCPRARAYIRGDLLLRHLRVKHPAIYMQHVTHLRQAMGLDTFAGERLTKEESDSLITMLDAMQSKSYIAIGAGGGADSELANNTSAPQTPEGTKPLRENNNSPLMNEEELVENMKHLLVKLIDTETLECFGWPDQNVDDVLEKVIEQCGARPAKPGKFTRVQCLRENAKHLFLHVIEDEAITRMLNTHTIDQVVRHILTVTE